VRSGDTFIFRRWCNVLSMGSVCAPLSARLGEHVSSMPSRPAILFWMGFAAPWCWLVGGWLVSEGRWDARHSGRGRAQGGPALPLWKVDGRVVDSAGNEVVVDERQPRWWDWRGRKGNKSQDNWPVRENNEPWHVRWVAYASQGVPKGERKSLARIVLSQPGPEAWVLRCRVAAFVSGVLIVIAFVVCLVIAVHVAR